MWVCFNFSALYTYPCITNKPTWCTHLRLVLGKFGPGLIGTWSGLDQTPQSWSRSGIFPKIWDHLVSSLGNPILPETVPDPVWTGTT